MTRYQAVIIFVLLSMFTGCDRQLSDRDVFHRAAVAAKSAKPETRWHDFEEIAKAEAEHGHYDDALHGWNLSEKFPDQLYADIVAIRARTGDIAGAKKMVDGAADENAKQLSLCAIALVQAEAGDTAGAKESMRSLPNRFQQEVLEAIGTQQAQSGDLESALKTASEMERGWSDRVLFAVAEKFTARGDKTRAHEIALRMVNRSWAQRGGASPSDSGDLGGQGSNSGGFDGTIKRLNGANSDCQTLAYIHEKSGDLVGAEKAMRTCPSPKDVSAGMAELATQSATKGNIDAALKFAEAAHVHGSEFEGNYLAPALRAIARNWTLKDRAAALRWAEARPDGDQRAMALIGVAEGMRP